MYNTSRCTGIYKLENNTYPQRIRHRSNLGHIFREKSGLVSMVYLLCFYYMFWRYLQHHQGELCVLYFKPHAVTQLLYRVIQEESARLREMIVCVILSKKVHMNMGPILNGYGVMTA